MMKRGIYLYIPYTIESIMYIVYIINADVK